jgi:hypothetical protein
MAPNDAGVLDDQSHPTVATERNFLQASAGLVGEFVVHAGGLCEGTSSCILGSGAGVVARAGWRNTSPFFLGAAYELTRHDADNLYRLATLQHIRGEVRYIMDSQMQTRPFLVAGVGILAYGNEWGVDSQGAALSLGIGMESELGPSTLASTCLSYRTAYFTPFQVATVGVLPGSVAHFLSLEFTLDVLEPM